MANVSMDKVSQRFRGKCQVCGQFTKHVKKHYLRSHIPWYMNPATACADCQLSEGTERELRTFHGPHQKFSTDLLIQAWFWLVNGVFLFISHQLGLASISDLLNYIVAHKLFPTTLRFTEEEFVFLSEFDRRAGLEPLAPSGYMCLPPVRICVMSHYDIMLILINQLTDSAKLSLKSLIRYAEIDGSSPPTGYPKLKMGIIDSHFHLDLLSGRTNKSLSDLESSLTTQTHLRFGIANFVFPTHWEKIDKHIIDPRIRVTLGVHPHVIKKSTAMHYFHKLEDIVSLNPTAVGIGEVGLDLTTTCHCRQVHNKRQCQVGKIEGQRQFLRPAFQLAKELKKVIVIHVRDHGSGKAAREVLSLLLELGLEDHPIHRHCFVGGEEEYWQWSSHLSNCYFSISSATLKSAATVAGLCALQNPTRLILETDAPYLSPNPWSVITVAEGAARYLGINVTEFVGVCNRNAARLYNLPW